MIRRRIVGEGGHTPRRAAFAAWLALALPLEGLILPLLAA